MGRWSLFERPSLNSDDGICWAVRSGIAVVTLLVGSGGDLDDALAVVADAKDHAFGLAGEVWWAVEEG